MKKIMNLKRIIAFAILILSFGSYGQGKINYDEISSQWSLVQTTDGIEIYVMKVECKLSEKFKPSEWLFYKFKNTTNKAKDLAFVPVYRYAEGCVNCGEKFEATISTSIPANTFIEGNCNFENRMLTYCIKNPNLMGGWMLTQIEIKNITIK